MTAASPFLSRRHLLQGAFGLAALGIAPGAWAHNGAGAVTPALPVPRVPVTLHDGRQTDLRSLLRGRATALQLMFTGCSSTCPIQGALFAAAQDAMRQPGARPVSAPQLLSVSIDPLGDDAAALDKWRKQFGAGEGWSAAVPGVKALDPWLEFLQGRKPGPDAHTAQVYFFNRRAELVLRTVDFPPPEEVARLLRALASEA